GDNISPSSKESGEPHAPLWSKNPWDRYGPASPSSAVHAERYPGTRQTADPVYKVVRRGALPCSSPEMVAVSGGENPRLNGAYQSPRSDLEPSSARRSAGAVINRAAARPTNWR